MGSFQETYNNLKRVQLPLDWFRTQTWLPFHYFGTQHSGRDVMCKGSISFNPVQTDATLLNVKCCVRLHNLLHVVAQSLIPVNLLRQQPPTFLLVCDRRSVAQLFHHRWGHVRTSHVVSKVLKAVFFLRCTADPNIDGSCCIRLHTTANTNRTTPAIVGPTIMGVVAFFYATLPTRTQQLEPQHCWPNSVESCCVRLHVALQIADKAYR